MIDLLNEMADDREGPALAWIRRHPRARLWISPVTVAEVLEGAEDPEAVCAYLRRFAWQGIHRMHGESVALRQKRSPHRLGENDAWQCAIAERIDAVVVGHDAAFRQLGRSYEDHRRTSEPL